MSDACCDTGRLYINNDIPVEVTGLHYTDVSPYEPVTDASVTLNIYDAGGSLFSGPYAMAYNADVDAYESVVPAATPFVEGNVYTFIFTIVFSSGRINTMELQDTLVAEIREA